MLSLCRNTIALALFTALFLLKSTSAESEVKPTGILRFNEKTFALFEEYLSTPARFHTTIRLEPKEHSGVSSGKKSLLVQEIDTQKGEIQYQLGGSNKVARIKTALSADLPGVAFDGANIDQVIAIYAMVAKTNVLPHPELPPTKFSFTTSLSDQDSALKSLRDQFNQADVDLLPFTQNILLAIPRKSQTPKSMAQKYIKPKSPTRRFPPGSLELHGAPIGVLIEICAEVLGLEPEPSNLFGPFLSHEIQTVTSTTAEEMSDALQLLIEWYGYRLSIAPEGKLSAQPIK